MEAGPNRHSEWTDEQNIAEAVKLKAEGNNHFKAKNYKEALRAYHKAILHLAGVITSSSPVAMYSKKLATEQNKEQAKQLSFTVYMNMAQIYILQEKYERGLDALAKAEKYQTNAKFFYRRGICMMKVGNFDQARSDLTKVVDLDPSQRNEAEIILNQLHAKEKQQDQKSKAMFQKFFN